MDQTVLLTQNIEDSFETRKKAGAVFVNLTAAYDTVWYRGLTCKLLRLLTKQAKQVKTFAKLPLTEIGLGSPFFSISTHTICLP